ncbi:MAG: aminopeptidase P family protein [Clostridia bacterium]|nr:aminopeptidase P family protein [Clostridia bacterium]
MNPIERLSERLIHGDAKKAVLVHSRPNRYYLTSFPSSAGILLVTAGKAYYLLDFRYAEAARAKAKGAEVVDLMNMDETLKGLLTKHGVQEVYMEYTALPYGTAMRYKKICESAGAEAIFDTTLDDALKAQRIIKSEEEIGKIAAAQAITDKAFTHILGFIHAGVTEREIALELEFFMRKNGADGNAFNPIVVTGKNGSQCHGVPGDTVVQDGDLITMDFGAMLNGYNSDMTRTVAVGHVSDEQRDIYNTVLRAQVAAIDAIRAGVRCCDIDKVARDIIETPYPETFGHSLGHGVGFEIHEWPGFSKVDQSLTEPGMVITVEPGIYVAGKCGVRIEDMIVVTEDGCRNLTHSPKELIIL